MKTARRNFPRISHPRSRSRSLPADLQKLAVKAKRNETRTTSDKFLNSIKNALLVAKTPALRTHLQKIIELDDEIKKCEEEMVDAKFNTEKSQELHLELTKLIKNTHQKLHEIHLKIQEFHTHLKPQYKKMIECLESIDPEEANVIIKALNL